MRTELLPVGFGSVVVTNRILAIVNPDSAPVRQMVRQAEEEGSLIKLTYGRKVKAVIILDTGHIVLSAIHPGTLAERVRQQWDRVSKTSTKEQEDS
jgi:regulator of extracellular matrix RemA (YlzA/DUF370 family)